MAREIYEVFYLPISRCALNNQVPLFIITVNWTFYVNYNWYVIGYL